MESEYASSTTALTSVVPRPEDILRVSQVETAVNRNLQITDTYRQLSFAFITHSGMIANWCTFATWASKQAGVTIRREDLLRAIELRLRSEPEVKQILDIILAYSRQMGKGIIHENIHENALAKIVRASANRASQAVAKGNKKVFEEIGYEFARFLSNCFTDRVYDPVSLKNFVDSLRAGPAPDGQDLLKTAFENYYAGLFEPDLKKRDELFLLGNIQIGLHEQTRLQPEIYDALNAGKIDVEELKKYLTDLLVYNKTWKGKIIYFFQWVMGKTNLLKSAVEKFVARAQQPIREVITEHLMTLNFPPNTCIRLGRNLNMQYPSSLQQLQNDQLKNLFLELRPKPDSIDGEGCSDWSDLRQRIHFIANLFRCCHDTTDLFNEAFTEDQLKVIRAGDVPKGKL